MSTKIKNIVKDSDFVKMYTKDLTEEERKLLDEYTERVTNAFQTIVDHYKAASVTEDGKKKIQEEVNETIGFPKEGWGEPKGKKE